MKIYLSPSSQPHNAYSAGNTTEQVQCNRIAEYAKIALERNGYEVKKDAEGTSNTAKVNSGNAWGADLYICIHTNAGGSSKGTMGLCYPGCVNNPYMQSIYASVASVTPWPDNGIVVRSDLYEINSTRMMCVYMECAFHDKADSAQWIIDHAKTLGDAIAKGVCDAEGKVFMTDDQPKQDIQQVPGEILTNYGLKYRAHCQTVGWLPWVQDGQVAGTIRYRKRLEAIQIDTTELKKKYPNAKLNVKAHLQGYGWKLYEDVQKDTLIGSEGESKRLEAIEMELIGVEGKQVYYRTHLTDVGWTNTIKGGFTSGTVGISKAIEAIQIYIK